MESEKNNADYHVPWNIGQSTRQKPPLKLREIWAIRTRLQRVLNIRELAMFNLAIDGKKIWACELARLKMQGVRHGRGTAVPRRFQVCRI